MRIASYFITNIEQIILYRIYDRQAFWKFLTKITVNFRKLSQNRVLLSRRSGIHFSKFFKVARTYLKSEIVQNLALKESHLLINFVKNELLQKNLLRILRLFMEAYTCHNMALILSLVIRICIGLMYFLLSLSLNSKLCNETCFFKNYICRSISVQSQL